MRIGVTREDVLKVVRGASDLRSPSVASLYGVLENGRAELMGSGMYVQHKDDVFVLTAYHVVKRSADYSYVFSDIGGDGAKMVPLRDSWTGWGVADGDLALWRGFGEFLDDSDRVPYPLVEPFAEETPDAGTLVVAAGFPEQLSFPLPFLREYRGTLHCPAGPVVSTAGLRPFAFAFSCANDIDYQGMSGGPVWRFGLDSTQSPDEWQASHVRFAGVLTRWDADAGVLVATGATTVKRFLAGRDGAIERLRARKM